LPVSAHFKLKMRALQHSKTNVYRPSNGRIGAFIAKPVITGFSLFAGRFSSHQTQVGEEDNMTQVSMTLLAVFVGLSFFLSVFYFPLFFLLWGVLNRKSINPVVSMSQLVLSIIVPLQLYSNFFSKVSRHLNWLSPYENPILLFGSFLAILFLTSRFILYRARLRNVNNYVIGGFFALLHAILLLSPVLYIRHLIYSKNAPAVMSSMWTIEVPIAMWILFVYFLFANYPEDALIKKLIHFKSDMERLVQKSEKLS
jgi:hypothetical protein